LIVAGKPARRIVTGRRNRPVGSFPSRKNNDIVEFESFLELDALTIVDTDPSVLSYSAQPRTLTWRDAAGRPRRYTPDLLLRTALGRIYREIKPARRLLRDPSLGGRIDTIVACCEAEGAAFETWSDMEIRREPRLSNARRVVAAGRWRRRDADAEAAILGFAATAGMTIGQVGIEAELAPDRVRQAVLRLGALGLLAIELDERPIGLLTPIRLRSPA
jgi:hypothetical protein